MRRKDNASTTPRPAMNHVKPSIESIMPHDLVCMNDYASSHPLSIDLAYARADNLLFAQRIYKKNAQLWLYKDLAQVVLAASKRVNHDIGGRLVLYDGLRVYEAQAAMLQTQQVKDHPQWLEEPRLLSPPGAGGHPRGMAVDVSVMDGDGALLDMGTAFDFLSDDPSPHINRAHRQYPHAQSILDHRAILDRAMMSAAQECNITLEALAQEWWDFRLPRDFYERFKPVRDADLPVHMRLMD